MAALPSPNEVAGKHYAIFEAYYKQIDPKGLGNIPAMDAAKFLKKSALSDVVLSRIWDLSDPNGKGCLDKSGFFVALKLVSLAQCGQVINMKNIFMETQNPPKVGEIPKIVPQKPQSIAPNSNDWSMTVIERLKYENLFESLKPVNGLLHGNAVKKVLMDSKLPMETLGKVWDLADQDRDGSLDKHEFTVAMHLVYQALAKRAVPEMLPPELQRGAKQVTGGGVPPPRPGAPVMPKAPSGEGFGDSGFVADFPTDIAPPPVQPLPAVVQTAAPHTHPNNMMPSLISTEPIIPMAAAPSTQVEWVVTATDMIRYEQMFRESDRDKDGLVSGLEVKNVFLQSGVQQNCLAHIWALCDTNQSGKLTHEQFALAMWMVERKKAGIEPPEALTTNMIPPSLRSVVKGVDVVQQVESKPVYQNPELEMISKEIEDLAKERRVLETDIAQKEADIRIKTGEVRSLQSELDTLTATLKQLENQKGEAQKRLDDLKAQVNKIRDQCQKQEETINEQEGELNAKKSELQKLKDEENALEKEYDENRKELENLTKQLSDTHMQISQIRAMVTQLLETQRQMVDALLLCKAVIESNDFSVISDYSLQIEPDFNEARQALEKKSEPAKVEPVEQTQDASDAFGDASAKFPTTFNDNNFTASSGFDDAFGASNTGFGSTGGDPFGDNRNSAISPIPPGKDDFGSDPFAILHAPTGQGQVLSPNAQKSGPPPRPESPSPALPPKKSKQPPPRPAPPRPMQGPTRPAPPVDSFSNAGGGFADFDDFDNKLLSFQTPPTSTTKSKSENTSNKFNTQFTKSITQQQINSNTLPLNNQKSITPKQQKRQITASPSAATSNSEIQNSTIFSSSSMSSLASINFSTLSTVQQNANSTGVISGKRPTDFSDDPFKDYRYEDVFNIKDPFDDDEYDNNNDDELSSEDPFSTDSNKNDMSPKNNNLKKSHELIDDFKITPEPSPEITQQQQQQSQNTNNNFTTISNNFANFDAFETKAIKNNSNDDTSNLFAKFDNNNSNNVFDSFNDSAFDTKDFTKNNNLTTNKFDPFGISTSPNNMNSSAVMTAPTIKSSKKFENNFNEFEDDFLKMKITNTSQPTTVIDNFARFDVFNDNNINKKNNLTKIIKNNNNNTQGSKLNEKFASDYSKTDTDFDRDLQEALTKSMQEK